MKTTLSIATFCSFLMLGGLAVAGTEMVGEIQHGPGNNANIITVGANYDQGTGTSCVHVALTRNGGGAASDIACTGVSAKPSYRVSKLETLPHADDNELTVFKVVDRQGQVTCYGNALTRAGNLIRDDRGAVQLMGAGADVSIVCR